MNEPPLSELHRAILDAAPDGICGLNADGVATFVNPAAARMTGWEPFELIGRPMHLLTRRAWHDGTPYFASKCPVYAVCRHGEVHHRGEDVFWRKDGTSFPVSYTADPMVADGKLSGSVVVFRDISDWIERRERLELLVRDRTRDLERANSHLCSVLGGATLVAIISTGRDGTIRLFNQAAERMLGYQFGEVVGLRTPLIFHLKEELDSRARELAEQFGHPVDGLGTLTKGASLGFSEPWECNFVRKDGSHLPVCLATTLVSGDDGNPDGYLYVAYDISKRKRAEDTLRAAMVAAESANRAKSGFLAAMSHEIRTPMNGILGMADLLLKSELDPRQRKRTETLRDSAQGLLGVLNDILDFSKIEAGKLELEVSDFDLRPVVEGVADLMAVKAQEKALELTCVIEPAVPTKLRGDPGRLRQVLVNLVGNAVKFTLRGDVCIRVRKVDGSGAGSIRFEIADTGIGVPLEKQHLLFERFSQADASTARQYGGTGLGLSIVRGLVEMMGGETGFHSAEGHGSTFWFTADLPAQSGAERPPALSLAGKRVLVVDDNAASRSLLLELLGFWQCSTEEAVSAATALERLKVPSSPPFDSVIVDLEMPGFTGDLLGSAIRREPALRNIPILLLIPLKQSASAGLWESRGFCARVTKPVKQGELGGCLAAAFGHGPQSALPPNLAGRARAASNANKRHHRLLVAEDNVVNQEVLIGMLEHLGYHADIVGDGWSALEALRREDYAVLLTDCQMPGMDGYELARRVRDAPGEVRNSRIPIVAVTAHSLSGDREKCLAARMDDYLSKPIQPACLEEVLSRWTQGKPIAAPGPKPIQELNTVEFDANDLVERLMGNEALARRVAGAFIDTMPEQLAALANAIRNSDAAGTVMAAHTIKGAAANVGGSAVRDVAHRLEKLGQSGSMDAALQVLPELDAKFESLKPALQGFCGIKG